ncbi:MAG: energy transducer TonB [Alphaproteobacteria bacterium]|nr:energy transducer TonB [Alphaproteobacteria bacterium]
MLNTPVSRAPTAALLALPVAYGLFLLMSSLIDVKEVTLVKTPPRILDAITPQLPDTLDEIRKRPKPQPLDAAIKPPPPPQISTTQATIDLPVIRISGGGPTSLPTHVTMPTIAPVVVSSRGYQVIRPPLPVYPSQAATRGISGSCSVAFAIDPRGKPYKVSATCTDPVFKSEAERSVLKAEFAPQLVDGRFVSVTGLEYPLDFKLAE